MIDINNQILSLNYEEAEQEIARLIGLGYTDLILTFPILMNGEYNIEEMISKFNLFKVSFSGIRFYLGNEIHYHYTMLHRLKQKDVLSLNQSKYLFIKLPDKTFPDQFRQMLKALDGYTIILSCANRYTYFSCNDLLALREQGIMLFTSIHDLNKRCAKRLLKKEALDLVGTYDSVGDIMKIKSIKACNPPYVRKITFDNFKEIVKIDL